MNNLTTCNPYGIKFFRLSDLKPLNVNKYFNCLRLLKLLFENPDFKASTPGFYINYISNTHPDDDDGNSVRLTYFTNNGAETKKVIRNFINKNSNVKIYPSKGRSEPHLGFVGGIDPEEELRARNFLNVYTHIGLDLLNPNILLDFRTLVARYMSNFLPRGISGESLFKPFFDEYSNFFKNELDDSKREQLWKDLSYCPRRLLCFPHFLANMFAVSDFGEIVI